MFRKIALRDAPSNRRRGGDLRVVLVPANVRHRVANGGTTPAEVVFHMAPLAPECDLDHVADLRVGSAA